MPQDDVLSHCEDWNEHEMLVDHSDASVQSIEWGSDIEDFAIDKDLTRVGIKQTVDDVHEGGFSCAVFSKDRVNLTIAYAEIYSIVCNKIAKALCDPAQLQRHSDNLHNSCFKYLLLEKVRRADTEVPARLYLVFT